VRSDSAQSQDACVPLSIDALENLPGSGYALSGEGAVLLSTPSALGYWLPNRVPETVLLRTRPTAYGAAEKAEFAARNFEGFIEPLACPLATREEFCFVDWLWGVATVLCLRESLGRRLVRSQDGQHEARQYFAVIVGHLEEKQRFTR
jgi:hypothetical protein